MTVTTPGSAIAPESAIPHQSLGALFLRFLRFGSLAWGGPVAQIAMIQRELVEEERWIGRERFNRALAVYQVLPGPEAHELCVYFGMLARGRVGGLLAGLGFMLPGFVLMFLLSWLYVESQGALGPTWHGAFLGMQAAVLALIVRAVHRIGSHALHDRWLLGVAVASFLASLAGVHFAINLALAGAFYWAWRERELGIRKFVTAAWIVVAGVAVLFPLPDVSGGLAPIRSGDVSLPLLFWSGLKGGLLTFGGAYTAIPFLQRDAVVTGGWMTNQQFLDGLALSGILPAPLIIFSTFVGFLGGGALGALVLTAGIFLPAFGFTLLAHDALERLIAKSATHSVLDGITAGVVGLIAATTVRLAPTALPSVQALAVFGASLALLYLIRHRLNVLLVVTCAGLIGILAFR